MSARNEISAPTRDSLRAALEAACADLPAPRRKHVVEGLIAHLDELPHEEASWVLNDVGSYVREMRDAWGLEIVDAHPRPRRRLIAMAVTAVLVAAGAGIAIGIWASDGSGSTGAQDAVVIPPLLGLTQDHATALLASVGLSAKVDYQPRADPLGTVVSQQPAEGGKLARGAHVVVNVGAPAGGPLLTSMPARAVPLTQVAAISTGKTVVLYYAAIAVGTQPPRSASRFATVRGRTAPIPQPLGGSGPGICQAVTVFTIDVGGPGNGGCTDPRQLARITYTYLGGYAFGLTSLPATSVRIALTGTPQAVTVTTRTVSQFSGLRFFIAKSGTPPTTSTPPAATLAALNRNGKILLSIHEPPS